MSLVTIQRSPTPSDRIDGEDSTDHISELSDSTNEDYFAYKGTVILQNQIGRRRSSIIKEEETVQCFLKKIVKLLRHGEKLKLMVNIEKVNCKIDGFRYFCLIARNGKQDTEESLILGVNVSIFGATLGFVLPIYQDMTVKLDGDGGFELKYNDGEKHFKPTSVHALWSTVQLLDKACKIAHQNNYYQGGLNHTWINYYQNQIHSARAQVAEWNKMLDADAVANSNLAPKSAISEYVIGTEIDERTRNQEAIRKHLEEIMREEDMDNVTVTFLREKLQKKVKIKLNDYKRFIAEEILIIYGKMDEPSQILPYLFLGSTYNASNLEELEKNKITHILNVTRESENFFREKFIYKNVLVFDVEDTKLLKHFDSCYKFINEAKIKNGTCLVHCQRGISRSASIVISYVMKELNMSLKNAFDFVKEKRDCIKPNDGFMQQLKTYQGILQASSNRYNSKFQGEKRNTYDGNECVDKDILVDSSTFQIESKRASLGNEFHSTNLSLDTQNRNSENNLLFNSSMKMDFEFRNNAFSENEDTLNISPDFGFMVDFSETQSVFESTDADKNSELNNEKSFPIDLNANMSPEKMLSRNSSNEKKSVRIKCDKSWIKSSNSSESQNENSTPLAFNDSSIVHDFSRGRSKSSIESDSNSPPTHSEYHTSFHPVQ